MRRQLLWLSVTVSATFVACGPPTVTEPRPESRGAMMSRGAGKADGTSSCFQNCGSQTPAGCWCDADCEKYGDCCPDYADACTPRAPGSCAGSCGGRAAKGCYCDALCSRFGDCCPDVLDECAFSDGGGSDTDAGVAGDSSDTSDAPPWWVDSSAGDASTGDGDISVGDGDISTGDGGDGGWWWPDAWLQGDAGGLCGDLICSAGESCSSCPVDCGSCSTGDAWWSSDAGSSNDAG